MKKARWRLGLKAFLAAFVLSYVIPFSALAGWYGLTHIRDQEIRKSPDWPCGPWEPGFREHVADALYRIYYHSLVPGRQVMMILYPELRDREYRVKAYGFEPFGPEMPVCCGDYDRSTLRRNLTYFGGGAAMVFWLPLMVGIGLLRRFCFGSTPSENGIPDPE